MFDHVAGEDAVEADVLWDFIERVERLQALRDEKIVAKGLDAVNIRAHPGEGAHHLAFAGAKVEQSQAREIFSPDRARQPPCARAGQIVVRSAGVSFVRFGRKPTRVVKLAELFGSRTRIAE